MIAKIKKKIESHNGFFSWPIQQYFFAPFWSALKKPTWGFKFLHISHQFIRQEKRKVKMVPNIRKTFYGVS